MSFVVRILLTESNGKEADAVVKGMIHADGRYEYKTLERAREAALVACEAAASMGPSGAQAVSDEVWTEHPDRSDAADV